MTSRRNPVWKSAAVPGRSRVPTQEPEILSTIALTSYPGRTEADGENTTRRRAVEGHIHRVFTTSQSRSLLRLQQRPPPADRWHRRACRGPSGRSREWPAQAGCRHTSGTGSQVNTRDKQADECGSQRRSRAWETVPSQLPATAPAVKAGTMARSMARQPKAAQERLLANWVQRVQGQEGGRGHQARHDHQQQHPAAHADHRGEVAGGKENYRHQGPVQALSASSGGVIPPRPPAQLSYFEIETVPVEHGLVLYHHPVAALAHQGMSRRWRMLRASAMIPFSGIIFLVQAPKPSTGQSSSCSRSVSTGTFMVAMTWPFMTCMTCMRSGHQFIRGVNVGSP